MFWKAVVVAVWVAIVARWTAFRKRRQREGLPLVRNKRTGVYEVSDWTETVERGAIWSRNAIYGLVLVWWTLLGGGYVLYGREGAEAVFQGFWNLLETIFTAL